ncbi:hypothetical protein LX32DRAFT_444474 [Colletotrichum zoysiae]|uniref:Uncharacterized protein n=1 Tax=Colletotrichum zoysiae TaxID=1216348 RepID=A0AAD9M6Z2_9PEZI|nr:hypothetical protein LX32DRAFT_444474 [Colletotrichum zoysiae]
MTNNRLPHGPMPTHLSSDHHRSSQEVSQHRRDSAITSLPSLRPSNSAPRRSYATHFQPLNEYGGDSCSLCGTDDRRQSTTSQKPHSDTISSLSTGYVPVSQPTTQVRLRETREVPRLEARTTSDIEIRAQNSDEDLFVKQDSPARGSSFLDHSATHFPAPSSPLRIPSSPTGNYIDNLRVMAKLQSRSYQNGFFPETDSSSSLDPLIDEDGGVIANASKGTLVSGFIIEDDDSDNSARENKITPEARDSDRGLGKSELKQTGSAKSAVINDADISKDRPSQASPFLTDLEQAATPQDTTLESHSSLKVSVPKSEAEKRPQVQNRKSNAAQSAAQKNELMPSRASHSGFSLMSNMAIRAAKPSVRVEAVPKQVCIPGPQNPRQDARTSKT